MNRIIITGMFVLWLPLFCYAQPNTDNIDVTTGPNPTLRYGFYSNSSGKLMMGRYYFIDDGNDLQVRLVPFGKTPTDLPVKKYDREAGALEFGWQGKPDRTCQLQRHGNDVFLGNCLEGTSVMPMAIRIVNEHDAAWLGTYFPVTQTDIAIIELVQRKLAQQGSRNPNDERNCDDDIQSAKLSLFCTLYVASIEIDGVYRHRRPAMRIARTVLREQFPGDYAHLLRDINNNPQISDQALIDALEVARKQLKASSKN